MKSFCRRNILKFIKIFRRVSSLGYVEIKPALKKIDINFDYLINNYVAEAMKVMWCFMAVIYGEIIGELYSPLYGMTSFPSHLL
jgi:hypothetical protein